MRQPFPSFQQIRVLDLTDRWGQFAAKLLTQLGADVVLAEPPGGHELRRAWPLAVSSAGQPISLYFWHFNVGKRSVIVDPGTKGAATLARLAQAADVILVGADALDRLTSALPGGFGATSVVALSAYGLGHRDEDRADDLHVAARSGTAGLSGYGPEENSSPVLPPAEQAMHSAGLYGAIAALLAVRPGRAGELYDVSAQAAAFQGTEQLFAHWVYRREVLRRRGGGYATAFPTGRWQLASADGGYFYPFGLLPRTQREWTDLKDWMRREGAIQELDEPAYADLRELRGPNPVVISEHGRRAGEVIADFLRSMDGETAYREGQARGLGWGRVYQPHEVLGEEQFAVRGLFHRTAWPGTGDVYLTQSLPWIVASASARPAPDEVVCPPEAGQHTEAVLREWAEPAAGPQSPAGMRSARTSSARTSSPGMSSPGMSSPGMSSARMREADQDGR
jgi:crotonobetainyl-CoA:carnitine CoA-transferase CaiB-like acyl-CoA transferase